MSKNTSPQVVCRLLGGSGVAPLRVVHVKKLAALLRPPSRPAAEVVAAYVQPLPLAA
jgi:hypothetical protein